MVKVKKMTHFLSTTVKMKELPQLRSIVMMNSYFRLKVHFIFPSSDDEDLLVL
jgi:hypothetical protein